MSKMTEYMDAAVGYDLNGNPASTTQFTFGFAPMMMSEDENLEDVMSVTTVCQSDAIVDIKIIDNIAMVSFDFSQDTQTLAELADEIEAYNQLKDHVSQSLSKLTAELSVAERNNDEKLIEELSLQIRSLNVPFMMPTIMPECFEGTVQVGFLDDPKFVVFTADKISHQPYKIVMFIEAKNIFCQDEIDVYTIDVEAEIEAQHAELWYEQEAKKLEEEAYRAQFGYNVDLYDNENEDDVDKRLKGVRIK